MRKLKFYTMFISLLFAGNAALAQLSTGDEAPPLEISKIIDNKTISLENKFLFIDFWAGGRL